jgi:hypothetical protein
MKTFEGIFGLFFQLADSIYSNKPCSKKSPPSEKIESNAQQIVFCAGTTMQREKFIYTPFRKSDVFGPSWNVQRLLRYQHEKKREFQ